MIMTGEKHELHIGAASVFGKTADKRFVVSAQYLPRRDMWYIRATLSGKEFDWHAKTKETATYIAQGLLSGLGAAWAEDALKGNK